MKTFHRLSLVSTLMAAATFSSGSFAATATGTANATVLTPITITAGTALNFGTLAGNTAGTVTVTAAGARSTSGGVVVTSGAFSAASFTVGGTSGATFGVTYPASFNVTSGANTMAVLVGGGTAGANGAATGSLTSASISFPVGGVLSVGAAQPAGSYTGNYVMTVEYN